MHILSGPGVVIENIELHTVTQSERLEDIKDPGKPSPLVRFNVVYKIKENFRSYSMIL